MDPLSSREQEVVDHLLEGKSNKMIAAALHISESTVEFHLKKIYAKYQVRSRLELILKLRESTVANGEQIAENRDRFSDKGWMKSLKETISRISKEFKMESVAEQNARSDGSPMGFFEAILVCFRKYAEFQGRASRSEFWWFALFVILVDAAMMNISETLGSVFLIAVLLPFLAVGTRRLRDSGRSGWWQFFLLVPVGGIVVLGFLWAEPPAILQPEDQLPA